MPMVQTTLEIGTDARMIHNNHMGNQVLKVKDVANDVLFVYAGIYD